LEERIRGRLWGKVVDLSKQAKLQMEQSDIPVFYREGKWSKATSRFFIGIGNDNQLVTTKITSINFARPLRIVKHALSRKVLPFGGWGADEENMATKPTLNLQPLMVEVRRQRTNINTGKHEIPTWKGICDDFFPQML